jgi:N-acetyl-gamma-glutamyl-phosphate reductase
LNFDNFVMSASSLSASSSVRVAVVGATGYTGEVLLRLVAGHPRLSLVHVTSRASAGRPIVEAMPRLRGRIAEALVFENLSPADLVAVGDIDVAFLALPHGVAAEYAIPLREAGILTLDLSADFRLFSPSLYAEWYGHAHPAPDCLANVPYVLPELSDPSWRESTLLACPGCYPSSILYPLIPLLRARLHSGHGIVVNSLSGVSGAGKKAAETYLFCERAESIVAYGVTRHRHLSEIEEQLSLAADSSVILQFTPHLAPMRQGIHSTIVLPSEGRSLEEWYACWNETYAGRPCVRTLPPGRFPDTREVVETNRVDFSALADPRTGNIVITSVIDNLWKGAAGQAVQILNLRLDWPETLGLLP